jgi:hypothetical protein
LDEGGLLINLLERSRNSAGEVLCKHQFLIGF